MSRLGAPNPHWLLDCIPQPVRYGDNGRTMLWIDGEYREATEAEQWDIEQLQLADDDKSVSSETVDTSVHGWDDIGLRDKRGGAGV